MIGKESTGVKPKQKMYDMEFKAHAVSMVLKGSRISEVCNVLNIHRSNLNRWLYSKDQIIDAATLQILKSTKLQPKTKLSYRLRPSPWQSVIDHINSKLKADLCLTNAQLAEASMEFAIEQNLKEYKASYSFITKVRQSFFVSLFPNLYTGPSMLKTTKKSKDSEAGNGLFSNKDYYPGDTIAYYIGNMLTEREYNAQIRLGSTKGGYAHQLSVPRTQQIQPFHPSNSSERMLLDCYHCAMRGDCKASMANSPFGLAKFINGTQASANAHIKHKWRSTSRTDPDIYGRIPGPIVLLVAGRPQHGNESEESYKKYLKQICIKKDKEILCDYGDEYKYNYI